jgi:hypothetical protein
MLPRLVSEDMFGTGRCLFWASALVQPQLWKVISSVMLPHESKHRAQTLKVFCHCHRNTATSQRLSRSESGRALSGGVLEPAMSMRGCPVDLLFNLVWTFLFRYHTQNTNVLKQN